MFVLLALWRAIRRLWQSPASQGLLMASGGMIVIGALVYWWLEDLSWVDAFYLSVMTLSTVGYGDLAPETTAGRVFTTVFVLVGVGLLVALLSELSRVMLEDRGPRRRKGSAGGDDGLADE